MQKTGPIHRLLSLFLILAGMTASENLFGSILLIEDPFKISSQDARYGFVRRNNLINFRADAEYARRYSFGKIGLFQRYSGDAGTGNLFNNRDDEQFSLYWILPKIADFEFVNISNVILTSDDIRSDDNRYLRLNTNIGTAYSFARNSKALLLVGTESNRQGDLKSGGMLYGASVDIDERFRERYYIDTELDFEKLDLFDGRTNSDMLLRANLFGEFSGTDRISLSGNYENEKRDFLSYLEKDGNDIIENRSETEFGFSPGARFGLGKYVSASFDLNYSAAEISRGYNDYLPERQSTGTIRTRQISNLDLQASVETETESFSGETSVRFYAREENNTVENTADLDDKTFSSIKNREIALNNSASDFSLSNRGAWNITNRDSLYWNILYSVNRYDTPKEINNDDKDETKLISYLHIQRKMSPHLTVGISAEYRNKHLVYLKAERSAGNNQNHVLRVSPYVEINSSKFYYASRPEVLANYTVYDFESMSPGVKSYSFRRISYADSILFCIFEDLFIEGENRFRYFLNGILYWEEFTETPQMENIEYEIKTRLLVKRKDNYYGVGIRNISQERHDLTLDFDNLIYKNYSFGPEVVYKHLFSDGSKIFFSGWMERQVYRGNIKWIPNMELTCSVKF